MSAKPEQQTAELGNGKGRIVDGALHLELKLDHPLDPTEVIEEYEGKLVLRSAEGSYSVGEVRYYIARMEHMADQGISAFDALDDLCQDTCDFLPLITDREEDKPWSRVVYGACPEAGFGDLLVLSHLLVNPPFRGKRLGLHCVELVLRIAARGVSLVALRTEPSEYNMPPAMAEMNARERTEIRGRLISYFEKVGFKLLWGDEFMVLDPQETDSQGRIVEWEGDRGQACFKWAEEMEKYRIPEEKP